MITTTDDNRQQHVVNCLYCMCLTAPYRPTILPLCPDCDEQMPDPDNFAFSNASGELR